MVKYLLLIVIAGNIFMEAVKCNIENNNWLDELFPYNNNTKKYEKKTPDLIGIKNENLPKERILLIPTGKNWTVSSYCERCNFIRGMLNSNCEIKKKRICKDVCIIRNVCKRICRLKLSQVCKNISG